MSRNTTMGVALLLVGMMAGAAGVHAVQSLERARFLNSGLFTLAAGEAVNFNATLDDHRGGPPAKVLMRLLDSKGAVVARQDVVLEPGQSATLSYRLPGVFRAQAQIVEPDVPLGTRRIVVSTIEIFGLGTRTGETQAQALDFGIPRRFVCSSDDGAGNGRLPD
jgi:hypothetical protein